MKISIPKYTEEDFNIPDGGNIYSMRTDNRLLKNGLSMTRNHFEMLGMIKNPNEEVGVLYNKLAKYKKVKHVLSCQLNRDNKFRPVEKINTVDFLSSGVFGNGIFLNVILGNRELETMAPTFIGSTTVPMKVNGINAAGGYEIDLQGRIKANGHNGGYDLSVAIPNYLHFNFDEIKSKDILIIHQSGLIQSALITRFVSKKMETKTERGPVSIEMGRMGEVLPHPDNFPSNPNGFNPAAPYYFLRGNIESVTSFRNKVTLTKLYHMHIDAGTFKLEIIGNKNYIHGIPKPGKRIEALIWLQGWIFKHIPR